MNSIKIVSEDGIGYNTKVMDGETGKVIEGCNRISLWCEPDGLWQAQVGFTMPRVNIRIRRKKAKRQYRYQMLHCR